MNENRLADRAESKLPGIHAVAALNGLWGLFVPVSAARLYGWLMFQSASHGGLAIHMDWVLWLIPPGLLLALWVTVGLYLRNDSARRLSFAMAGVAVAVYALHLAAALMAPDHLQPVTPVLMITMYGWAVWYLTRPQVGKAFEE